MSTDYNTGILENSYPFNSLRLGVAYTNLNPTVKNTLLQYNYSRYALESLKNQFTTTISTDAFKIVSLTVTAKYCERINYKDYTIMDARVSFKQKRSSIYADVSNIFDVNYIQAGAVPMPGVWASLGYKITL